MSTLVGKKAPIFKATAVVNGNDFQNGKKRQYL